MGPNLKMNKSIFCLKITEIYVGKKKLKITKHCLSKKEKIKIQNSEFFYRNFQNLGKTKLSLGFGSKIGITKQNHKTSCRYKIWEDRPILLYILFRLRHVTCTTPTTSLEQPTSLPVSKGKTSGQSQSLTFLHEKLICSPQDFTK